MKKKLITQALLFTAVAGMTNAATLAHRYSYNDGTTTDSVGGNTGTLIGGATVSGGELRLDNSNGTGSNATSMQFTNTVGMGTVFGATGVTIESWYTDNNSSTWSKLFTFGAAVAGNEIGFTHTRSNTSQSGLDRNGNIDLGLRPAIDAEHHLVLSIATNGDTNLWIDGAQILTNQATNALSNVTSDVESVGSTAWNDPGHNGSVNEFRIWSGELTAGEVALNNTLGPDAIPEPSGLVLLSLATLLVVGRRRR